MGVNLGPNIVTNGLVLTLDAGNRNSYAGSGTNWYDLSGNANNCTLTNGPTFSSTNLGNISFDGVDDYVDFYAPNLGTTTTIELWCKLGATSLAMIFGWYIYDVFCWNGAMGFNTGNSDLYGISSSNVSNLGLVGNWKHYIFEMRSDVSYTNNKIYINTIPQVLSQQYGSEDAVYRQFKSGNGRISGWRYSASFFMQMNCANFKIYNRALTTSEITQNYNATKSRFGL